MFGSKKEKRVAKVLEQKIAGQSYWSIVKNRFRKNHLLAWALRFLYVFLFIAFFSDFIANEKPLYCKIEGKTYFPILKQYAVDLGFSSWERDFFIKDWNEHAYQAVIMAPIPYSATTIDRNNINFIGPFDQQNIPSWQYRHWLGTDELGRDIAAGMVAGTRVAMLVGVVAMSIAFLIGVTLGSLAGYFSDDRLKVSRIRLVLNIIGLFLAIFYGFVVRSFVLSESGEQDNFIGVFSVSFVIFTGILIAANLIVIPLKKITLLGKKITIPVDMFVMRLIEIMNSIPALLLILSIVAVIEKPSIIYVMIIIGLIRWTGIARFMRAELLKIRKLEYIEAAQAMGFSKWRIIFRHAIPNALTPVLITLAFGIAGAILLEAFLSFLGIGVSIEQVTWGSMLSWARTNFNAWWMAIFPGFAIFITVTLFNLIGEGLTDALDPKRKQP